MCTEPCRRLSTTTTPVRPSSRTVRSSTPTTPCVRSPLSQIAAPAQRNDLFSSNSAPVKTEFASPPTPRAGSRVRESPPSPSLESVSSASSVSRSSPDSVDELSIATQDLPDWAALLSLDPQDFAEVEEKLENVRRTYCYIDGRVFTSW
jgi:hypothetical protein